MTDVEYVEVARAESERGELVLRERREAGEEPVLELRVNGVFVMDTSEVSSEVALARSALATVDQPGRVLVGGLGLGFTTEAVLADERVERLVVAEIEDVLVGWFRDGVVTHGPGLLADERLEVAVEDVRTVVAGTKRGTLDLVLLDVDNGPDFLVLDANAAVYEAPFLTTVRDALCEGGQVAVWSSTRSEALERRLADVFGNSACEELPVALQGRLERYWLHSARKG